MDSKQQSSYFTTVVESLRKNAIAVHVARSTHFALKNFGLVVIYVISGTVVHVKVLSVNPYLINTFKLMVIIVKIIVFTIILIFMSSVFCYRHFHLFIEEGMLLSDQVKSPPHRSNPHLMVGGFDP